MPIAIAVTDNNQAPADDVVRQLADAAWGMREALAKKMIWVATPGVTTADLSTFTYQARRRPMYPFEDEARWPGS